MAAALPAVAAPGRGGAPELVEAEVRELVRLRGVDPLREPDAAAALVDEVLADYETRALVSDLPLVADRPQLARAVLDAVAGYGPLQRWLDDPTVEEIWVNRPDRVFVARGGRSELTTTVLAPGQIAELVERMLEATGRRVDLSQPFVDAMLPDGSRLHVVIPDVTRRDWSVNIRKFVVAADSVAQLVAAGSLSAGCARFLEAAVDSGLNIVVSGGTQAGKTTFLNCLAGTVGGGERVVTCEEVFELRLPNPDWVAMQCRQPNLEGHGEIRLRRLITEALRMRPDRLIVGEVRQEEALDLLVALNSGLPGMCTVHANSAREAVVKLCTLPLLAGPNIAAAFVVPTVAAAVDLVIHLERDHTGRRRVVEVLALTGGVEGDVVATASVYRTDPATGVLVRGDGYPPHPDRFTRHGHDLPTLLAGGGRPRAGVL
jgi:pilus assembly protein CpaF